MNAFRAYLLLGVFWMQVSNEEAKSVEVSKFQKMLEPLKLELDAAKLATINECNKNAVLQNQLELSVREKSALERELLGMAELRKENALLRVSLSFNYYFLFLDGGFILPKEPFQDLLIRSYYVALRC